MGTLLQDLRYAARMLRKNPGFTLTAAVTLALGIGATTAIFTLADAMLWKPVPIPGLDRLVMVLQQVPGDGLVNWNVLTPADLDDIKTRSSSFQSVSAWQQGLANIVGTNGEGVRAEQFLVAANFFATAGVKPILGRPFLSGEDQPGRNHVVILSDVLWHRNFGSDSNVIGKTIRLDDEDYQVVGVMPSTFDFPTAALLWTPMALTPEQRISRTSNSLLGFARLKPGVSIEQATAETEGISRNLATEFPMTNKKRRFMVWSVHRFLVGDFSRQYVLLTLGAAAFVLLIACANVANLQFARTTGRFREVAVRAALGASRWRMLRQLLTESVLLSLVGAAGGLLLALWGLDMLRAAMPAAVEKYVVGWKTMHIDARALAFTMGLAVFTGVIAGLAPAFQSSNADVNEALKQGGRSVSGGRTRLRGLLVGAQVALAMALLAGSGLMIKGFNHLLRDSQSLNPGARLTMRLAITEHKYGEPQQVKSYYTHVVSKLSALPGVKSAAIVSDLPHSQRWHSRTISVEGRPPVPGEPLVSQYQAVSARYFQILNIPLREGRLLQESDGTDSPEVAVISARAAHMFWPEVKSAIGRRFKFGGPDSNSRWITVAGVTGDIRHDFFDREPRPRFTCPILRQLHAGWTSLFELKMKPRCRLRQPSPPSAAWIRNSRSAN